MRPDSLFSWMGTKVSGRFAAIVNVPLMAAKSLGAIAVSGSVEYLIFTGSRRIVLSVTGMYSTGFAPLATLKDSTSPMLIELGAAAGSIWAVAVELNIVELSDAPWSTTSKATRAPLSADLI